MVEISIRADISKAIQGLNAFAQKQVPYAASLAINEVAFKVQAGERKNIETEFKHPRPFTVRSVLVNKASKSNLVADVFVRTEAAKYLDPYEFGGIHVTPGKALLNPVKQPVDAFGQLTKGTPKRLAGRKDVFVTSIHGHYGFWQRLGGAAAKRANGARLKLLIAFGRNDEVPKHLEFEARGVDMVRYLIPTTFAKALIKALASAR